MFLRAKTSLIALVAMSAPAFADVTPADVWQNWVDYYKQNGYTVTEGSRDESGGNLTVKDVVMTFEQPEATVKMTMPQLQMMASGDGKVTTMLPDASPMTIAAKDKDGKPVNIEATIGMAGGQVISSGVATDMTHETKVPQATITLDKLTTEDMTFEKPLTMTMADLVMNQHVVNSGATSMTYDLSAGKTEAVGDFSGKDKQGKEGSVKFNWATDSLKAKGEGTLPAGVDPAKNMATAVNAGLAFAGEFSVGAQTVALNMDVPGEEEGKRSVINAKADIKATTGSAAMGKDGLKAQSDVDAINVELTSPDLPVPVKYALESASSDIQIPMSKSEEAQPFKLAYSINGMTLNDEVWGLFDAQNKLPRDPISLDIDLTGQAKVTADMMDPETAKSLEEQAKAAEDGAEHPAPASPFEPIAVTINQFALSALGAKITASGDVAAADGQTLESAPVGKVNAKYEGVNGLLDKLVEAGLVPADQVQGARMMMMMFAKPAAEGSDVLTTDLEFKQDGSIFANGQQVK